MTNRWSRTVVVALSVLLSLATVPAAALAQHKPAQGGRIAGIASPPEPVVAPVTVPPPGQFLYGSIPVLVTPDGRVFADFGRGYEQLVRNCVTSVANFQAVQPAPASQPIPVQPQARPSYPAYTQPVPNQQTASQQMLNQPATTPAASSQNYLQNYQSCWSTDPRGRVIVGR